MKRAAALVALVLVASGVLVAVIGAVQTAAVSDREMGPTRTGTYTWRFDDFFNVPYDTWWTDSSQRQRVYGDVILSNAYPYANWYPWAGDRNNPTIYTMYRIDMSATGVGGWTLDTPVILPEFGPDTTLSPITIDYNMQYVSNTRRVELSGAGCFIPSGNMDGFIMEVQASFTMDSSTAEHIFGVSGDPATWWDSHTNPGCTDYAQLEIDWELWLSDLGNGAYDIFNSFEYPYSPWYTDIGYSLSGNTVTVSFHHITWGSEVLMAHWMYWGATPYSSLGTPIGWWPWELAWFEDFHLTGTIGTTSSFDLQTVMAYHLAASALPGTDGTIGTADDTPTWVFQPYLTDYLYSSRTHPTSELDAYIGRTTLHTTPGSIYYGDNTVYTYVPAEWDLISGESLVLDFPEANIVWYSPQSPETSDPSTLQSAAGPLTLAGTSPSGIGTWDEATNSLTLTGPLDPGLPANPDAGAPWVEIGVETAPPPVVHFLADLVRRSAWPERHHYVIGGDPDGTQTLYGKVQNLGDDPTAVSVRFTVWKGGAAYGTWDSSVVVLNPGQRMDLIVGLTDLPNGKYRVQAQAWYDTDGDGTPDTAGAKLKEFSFNVVS